MRGWGHGRWIQIADGGHTIEFDSMEQQGDESEIDDGSQEDEPETDSNPEWSAAKHPKIELSTLTKLTHINSIPHICTTVILHDRLFDCLIISYCFVLKQDLLC